MLDRITDLLPVTWRPFAKFIWPAILTLAGTFFYSIEQWIDSGSWVLDKPQLEVAAAGLFLATLAFLKSNGSAGWQRFWKSIAVALTALITLGVHELVYGEWNATSTRLAISGVVTALVVYFVPNMPFFNPTPDTPPSPDTPAVNPVVPPGMQAAK